MDLKTKCRLKPRSLKVGYFNANGISNQRDEIATFIRDYQLDVFLVQETFLKPAQRNPRLANYELVRNDRTRSAKGGTLIYYKRSLHCIPIDTPTLAHIEASICRIGMTGHSPITLVSAYIPPGNGALTIQPDFEALFALSDSVLIAGDFNAKHESWNSHSRNARGRNLEFLSSALNFDIVAPLQPTHYPQIIDHRPDVLDIALLKNVNLRIRSLEAFDELNSDHRPVILDLVSRVAPSDPGQPPPYQGGNGLEETEGPSSVYFDVPPLRLHTGRNRLDRRHDGRSRLPHGSRTNHHERLFTAGSSDRPCRSL